MNRDDLLKQFGVGVDKVEVLGEEIALKQMSGRDRDEYFTKLATADKIKTIIDGEESEIPDITGLKGFLISKLLVDDDRKPLLSIDEADGLGVEFTDAVFEQISKLNGLSDTEVDEAEKN